MKLFNVNGKQTAVIAMLVDPEKGFQQLGLNDEEGGVLYVPGGEEVTPLMGKIVSESRGAIFIIGQDYHPRNHISFMANHKGVMEYRMAEFRKLLERHGQSLPETEESLRNISQQPVHFLNDGVVLFPFPEIVLDENRNIFGLKEADGRIRRVKVETSSGLEPRANDRGRVSKVLDEYHRRTFDEFRNDGRLLTTQTLWTVHCVQGTESCQYPDSLNLPEGLVEKLRGDFMSPYIEHRDAATDNIYRIIRKGANPELDSYGIGVENDKRTRTVAFQVLEEIADDLQRMGCEQVLVYGGGLATNFCVEYSLNNTDDFLAGIFKMRGMKTQIFFLPEISRGIPIPGGPETPFSLDGTPGRLEDRGITKATLTEVLAITAQASPGLKYLFSPPGRQPG